MFCQSIITRKREKICKMFNLCFEKIYIFELFLNVFEKMCVFQTENKKHYENILVNIVFIYFDLLYN
jgi:hypothetical protein